MTAKKNAPVVPAASPAALAEFNPRDPQTLLATAAQLAQFVTDNKLASNIQGRSYVQAEGWQFLFAVAGLDVLCAKPARLERATEVCYEAEARLFDAAGREVGYGYAICSDAERLKKGWAEYAIASMAQTRAIGKAGRNRFAFVMKAAGFEPTPAEEMSEVGTSASVVAEAPKKPLAEASAPVSAAPAPSTGSAPNPVKPAVITNDPIAAADSVPMSVTGGGVSEAPAPAEVQYATASQKEEIIRLLNHPLITRQEKTKMLLNINRLDEERAIQAIAKLKKAIEDREGTTAVAEPAQPTAPAGNEPAGAPQDATPAGLPFADPAASTTSDPNAAPEPEAAPAPGFSSPEVAAIAAQIEGFTSSMDLKKYWDKLTGGQRKELLPVKEAKQKAILATIHQASATASRQNGGAMRPAGTDSALVDEFVNEPVVAGASFAPATQEQRNQLVSLLNDTRITFKEKAALLKALPNLDTERARQVLLVVREAIAQREAAGVAAQVAALAGPEIGEPHGDLDHETGLQAA